MDREAITAAFPSWEAKRVVWDLGMLLDETMRAYLWRHISIPSAGPVFIKCFILESYNEFYL